MSNISPASSVFHQASQITLQSSMENDEIRQRVLKNYAAFADVDPDLLSDYLKQESVISIEQWQEICGRNITPRSRCRALLDFLLAGNDPRAFLVIREVLRKTGHYLFSCLTEATEFQQACQPIFEEEISVVKFSSSKFGPEDLLDEDGENLVGELQEEDNLKPKKRSKQFLLAELSNENDLLRKEIENDRTEKQSLQSTIEQQRINAKMEAQTLKEELIKEKADYMAHIEKLKQELDNNKITNNELQAINDKLKHELASEKTTNNLLQVTNEKLVEELEQCKATLKTAETKAEKPMKKLDQISAAQATPHLVIEKDMGADSARPVSAQHHQKLAMRGPPMDGHHQKSANKTSALNRRKIGEENRENESKKYWINPANSSAHHSQPPANQMNASRREDPYQNVSRENIELNNSLRSRNLLPDSPQSRPPPAGRPPPPPYKPTINSPVRSKDYAVNDQTPANPEHTTYADLPFVPRNTLPRATPVQFLNVSKDTYAFLNKR